MRIFSTVIIAVLFLSINIGFSQVNKNFNEKHLKLQKFSKEKLIEQKQLKDEALIFAKNAGMPVKIDTKDGVTIELQRIYQGIPQYTKTNNVEAAQTVSSVKVWPNGGNNYNLTGSNVLLGIWDAGRVRLEHQEFTNNRVTQIDGAASNHSHSTHCAGTMVAAGVSTEAKGMSYMGSLNAYDWNYDVSEMADAADNGLQVSSHSYSYITGWYYNFYGDNRWVWFGEASVNTNEAYTFGFYGSVTRDWDEVANNAPYYLICKAAANDRGKGPTTQPVAHWYFLNGSRYFSSSAVREISGGTDGFDCLEGAAVAKNVLTVGAVYPITNGYTQPSDVIMTSFSSWGPTDDGRIKPDIVAAGVNIYSSIASSNTSYANYTGTSMASPNVAGSVGLLIQHQRDLHGDTRLLASTLKGLIIHTADEAGSNNGPDYAYGWGLMNTLSAINVMTLNSNYSSNFNIQEFELGNGESIELFGYSDGTKPIKATICWTDPAGTVTSPALNPRNAKLVNDIDLRVKIGNDTYLPWKLDVNNPGAAATTGDNTVDNVEQIYISNPAAGNVAIKINHKGNLAEGYQIVSLIITGISELTTVDLTYPENNASTQSNVTFDWNTIQRAETYQLQVSRVSDFSTIDYDVDNLSTNTHNLNALPEATSFYWRVRGKTSVTTGPWSEVRSFRTRGTEALKLNLSNKVTCYRVTVELGTKDSYGNIITATGGSGDYTFTWSPSGPLSDNTTGNPSFVSPSYSYDFTVTVKDNQSNQTIRGVVSVKVLKAPVIGFPSSVTITRGSSVNLGNYIIQNGGVPPYTYFWTDNNGWTSTDRNPVVSPTVSTRYYLTVTDSNGCSSIPVYLYIRVVNPRGEEILTEEDYQELMVYPNPANNIVNIDMGLSESSFIEIKLFNVLGQVLSSYHKNVTGRLFEQIDISQLSTGIYILHLNVNGKISTVQIMKQ